MDIGRKRFEAEQNILSLGVFECIFTFSSQLKRMKRDILLFIL